MPKSRRTAAAHTRVLGETIQIEASRAKGGLVESRGLVKTCGKTSAASRVAAMLRASSGWTGHSGL